MRSGEWLRDRDTKGARGSWERARAIADRLPADEEGVAGKRIAPRAQLTFKPWLVGEAADDERRFDELRQLTAQSGDLLSLAMGVAGRVTSLVIIHGLPRDAAALADELVELIDRIDGSAPERAEMLLAVAFSRYESGEVDEALHAVGRLLDMVPAAAATDLAPATCLAGVMKVIVGRTAEGRHDLEVGLRLAREEDPVTYAISLGYQADLMMSGFEVADEALVNEIGVPGPAVQLWLLRCRALLTNAVGDTVIGSQLVTQYRDLAEALDAPGHLAFAERFEAALRFEA